MFYWREERSGNWGEEQAGEGGEGNIARVVEGPGHGQHFDSPWPSHPYGTAIYPAC